MDIQQGSQAVVADITIGAIVAYEHGGAWGVCPRKARTGEVVEIRTSKYGRTIYIRTEGFCFPQQARDEDIFRVVGLNQQTASAVEEGAAPAA